MKIPRRSPATLLASLLVLAATLPSLGACGGDLAGSSGSGHADLSFVSDDFNGTNLSLSGDPEWTIDDDQNRFVLVDGFRTLRIVIERGTIKKGVTYDAGDSRDATVTLEESGKTWRSNGGTIRTLAAIGEDYELKLEGLTFTADSGDALGTFHLDGTLRNPR